MSTIGEETIAGVVEEVTTAAFDAGMDVGIDQCLVLFEALLQEDQRVPKEAAADILDVIRKELRR